MNNSNFGLVLILGFAVALGLLFLHMRLRMKSEDKVLKGYFLMGLSGLLAKIALADGKVTADESDLAMKFFHGMKLTETEKALCIGNFIAANREKATVRDLTNRFMAYGTPAACEFLYSLLWQMTKADGVLDPAEDKLMGEIALCLGVSPATLTRLKAGAKPAFSASVLRGAGVPDSLVALA